MFKTEREAEIIKLLEKDGKVEVDALAEQFGVSRETIRRDLKELKMQGVLTRTHGGAVPTHMGGAAMQEYPIDIRGIQNYSLKQEICQYAVSYIKDGETLFVDNSSTTMYLLRFLPAKLHATFITNSLKILVEASKFDCTNKLFVCLGGVFNSSNLSIYDNTSVLSGIEYYPDKCFVSCAGISLERMLTDTSILEIGTKKRMINSAKEVFLLADHTKFDTNGQFFLADFEQIDHIITDSQVTAETCDLYQNSGINIEIVSNP